MHSTIPFQESGKTFSQQVLLLPDILLEHRQSHARELIPNCEGLDDFFFIVIQVVSVYYSRKNFLRPELQPEEHRSFDVEVDYLDGFFHGEPDLSLVP